MTTTDLLVSLTATDYYILARLFAGLDWDGLHPSLAIRLLLSKLDARSHEDKAFLQRMLGRENMVQVLKVDPDSIPPEQHQTRTISFLPPALPESAQLSDNQIQQAQTVGHWLNDYVSWSGQSANETPMNFHVGAGLYLLSVAIGRRLFVQAPWQQQIFRNLYVMIVAVSTYYRKSAGLNLARQIAQDSIPHMLLPQPGSPENFMSMLGGVLPPNFNDLPDVDQKRLKLGMRFAAQRGLIRDEISGLFKAFGRDYMAGLKELIMTLYDCPAYLDSITNNKGIVIIKDAGLSILGAATPAELSTALTVGDWFNGNLARFALLTPEADYSVRPSNPSTNTTDLTKRLKYLHEQLPVEPDRIPAWSLSADIWDLCLNYEKALREMTAPESSLDDRLRAIYGRLHVQAIKVAILLSASDWADNPVSNKPIVTESHWYRAQVIVEEWRQSAHRLLSDLGNHSEVRLENRILSFLSETGGVATVRETYRSLRSLRKPVVEALKALEADGKVMKIDLPPKPGVRSEAYRLVEAD